MKKVLLFNLTFILYRSFLLAQSPISPNISNWVLTPQTVIVTPDDPTLENSLISGSDFLGATPIPAFTEKSVVIHLPALQNDGMLTYSVESDISGINVDSYQSTDGSNWQVLKLSNYHNGQGEDLQKIDFPASLSNKWLKVVFRNTSTSTRNLKELGLYQFNTTGRNQYFLVIGASITEASGRHTAWKQTINTRLEANYQPVIFNWAFSGDNTFGILSRLDTFLAKHPHAAYVMVETAGNDISQNRPLTYEKSLVNPYNAMVTNAREIISKIKAAHKIPVLSRISFRNYVGTNPVNGGLNQELGSLPYNFDMDKLIKDQVPLFWNEAERRGYLDFYQLTLNNQSWLLPSDGTHIFETQRFHIREFWVDFAYKYIYTGQRSPVVPYTEVVPNLQTLANTAVSLAENSHLAKDVWNARILAEQIANAATRLSLFDRLDAILQINITQNPINTTVTNGSTASFSIVAVGTETLTYQWQRNGVNISGATAATYSFTAALPDHNTSFRCVVSNSTGSITSTSAILSVTSSGSGGNNGLTAKYYSNVYATIPNTTPALTRVDANVNFSWGEAAPATGITPNAFAVRWTGKITPTNTGSYTFYTQSNDGAKLLINNSLIIDKWVYQGLTEWSGTITLTAGISYNIQLDFFEGNGEAICKLLWAGPGISKQVIPSAVLSPEAGVNTGPSITQHPNPITVLLGETATFAVTASGTGPLTYQWKKNGTNISGAVSSTYSFTPSLSDNTANFVAVVTNPQGSATSNAAVLTVSVPVTIPVINQHPLSGIYTEGDSVHLSVQATSTVAMTYQWQRNGVNIFGATHNSYHFKAGLSDHNAAFRVVVTNSAGPAISNTATIIVNANTVLPTIIVQPLSITVIQGSPASFAVTATSPVPLNYQWLKNGNPITGATQSIYTFNSSLLDNGTSFSVLVTNAAGTVPSETAILSVNAAILPSIVSEPLDITATDGDTVQFSAMATGTGPMSFQWQKNGTNIAGATQNVYRFKATLADNAAGYRVVITNVVGTANSTTAILTVNPSTVVHGLTARYYTSVYASIPPNPTLTRLDPNVNFAWATASPGVGISANAFAARWNGKIKVNTSELYTFYTFSDDGVKLWVNDVLLVDKWVYQGPTEWSASIALQAGTYYNLKLEYFEGSGDATCKLLYSSPSVAKAPIPTSLLYPEGTGARIDFANASEENSGLEMYPNPFSEVIYLKLFAGVAHTETLYIESVLGAEIKTLTVDIHEGDNQIPLPLEDLKTGVYIVNVAGNKKIICKR